MPKARRHLAANLRYAEVAVRDQPEKLSQLGWGARRTGSTLEPPGEVRDIGIVAEGETWVALDWKPPVDGGSWKDVGTSVDTEDLVSNQRRGVEFDYRVIAVNKAGAG